MGASGPLLPVRTWREAHATTNRLYVRDLDLCTCTTIVEPHFIISGALFDTLATISLNLSISTDCDLTWPCTNHLHSTSIAISLLFRSSERLSGLLATHAFLHHCAITSPHKVYRVQHPIQLKTRLLCEIRASKDTSAPSQSDLIFKARYPLGCSTMMSGEAWLYLLAVLINAVNLFLQVFFTIMYSDLEW